MHRIFLEKTRRSWLILLLPFYRFIRRCKPGWFSLEGLPKGNVYASAMQTEGNSLYRILFKPFFKRVRSEIASEEGLRRAAQDGAIVYVIRNIGQLEFNCFQHLFCEKGLPLSSFTNGISVRRFMPWPALKSAFITQMEALSKFGGFADPISSGYLASVVSEGQGLLFSLYVSELEDEGMLLTNSHKLLLSVIKSSESSGKKVYLVPLEFIWDRRPSRQEKSIIDILFGEKDNPGKIRKIVLFWRNYRHRAVAKVGEPISLENLFSGKTFSDERSKVIYLGKKVLDAFKLERRAVTGPPVRSRSWFVERVLVDEIFQQQFSKLAVDMGKSSEDLYDLAGKYLYGMSADVNYTYIEIGDAILNWVFKSLYNGLVFNEDGLREVKRLSSSKPVVFLPNHKSHVDYLLLSYILHNNCMTIPYVTAGINLSFWPLGPLLRRCGGYFIRRSFDNNRLYKLCIESYLRILLEEGYSQEVFIEGGRSRTGKLLSPRHGMIKMLLKAIDIGAVRDISFVPVSLTYDRVIEQADYEEELKGGVKEKEHATHIFRLLKYLKKQKRKYGRIYVNFGRPIYYSEMKDKVPKERLIFEIADSAAHEINRNIVITPQSVLAAAVLSKPQKGISLEELRERGFLFLDYLTKKSVPLADTIVSDPEGALSIALDGFVGDKIISYHDNLGLSFYSVDEDKRMRLEYYKNGCIHALASVSVLSNLLLKGTEGGFEISLSDLSDDFLTCKHLLKYEFRFSSSSSVDAHMQKILNYFASEGFVEILQDGRFEVKKEGKANLISFADLMRNFFESILVAVDSIKYGNIKRVEEKELIKEIMQTGRNKFVLGHIRYKEALSKENIINALRLFCELGILRNHSVELGTKGRKIYSSLGDKGAALKLKVQLERLI